MGDSIPRRGAGRGQRRRAFFGPFRARAAGRAFALGFDFAGFFAGRTAATAFAEPTGPDSSRNTIPRPRSSSIRRLAGTEVSWRSTPVSLISPKAESRATAAAGKAV